MSFFEILTCAIVIPSIVLIVLSVIGVFIYSNNPALCDGFMTFNVILFILGICALMIYGVGICVGIGPHRIDACHYHNLLEKRDYAIERIEDVPEERKDAYQKEIDELDVKIEKQRKAMSYGDWERYYKIYEE